MEEDVYKKELKQLQQRLGELHNRLYRKKVPVIIAYEGWDAAGKGGNIKRITGALDPRGYEVHPIASPEPHEKARHYLWRFWTRLPRTGHIAIFDRTWYGRVMVERLEGFCSENDWMRAYNEINEFEKELARLGSCDHQILGADRQRYAACPFYRSAEYARKAMEDYRGRLAQP